MLGGIVAVLTMIAISELCRLDHTKYIAGMVCKSKENLDFYD
jgi:hypothetical protein